MSLFQLLVLAVVQGITEFLPISSDGHLVIVGEWFKRSGAKMDLPAVIVALHLGTLFSIIVFYSKRLWSLLGEDRRVVPLLIIGTIPAVIFGLSMKYIPALKQWLDNPMLAGWMLMVTGLCLLWAERQAVGRFDYRTMPWWKSLLIGCAQATAILPGLSRSGTTISSALTLGLTRESAATFSFVLGVPAIAGAVLLEAKDMWKEIKQGEFQMGVELPHLALAVIVSFVVGLASIWVLVRILEKGRLHWFGYYCILLGMGVVTWQWTKPV